MQAAAERMQRGYLQRDSSPRGWGPRRGTPAAARGVLEILAAKERSPRSIGNVAKLEYIFLPQTLLAQGRSLARGQLRERAPAGVPRPKLPITSTMTIKNDENSANRQKQRCQALEIFSEQWLQSCKK